jgi:hypothetical protein
VRREQRVGGQRLRVRRHHRGEVEHGRPPPLGSHEGHCRGNAGVHSRCLAGSFCCEDLRRPRMGSMEAEKPPSTPSWASANDFTQLSDGEASCPLR